MRSPRSVRRPSTRGVQRIALLSGRGEPEAKVSEDALLAAVPGATILRSSWFMQDFSEHFLYEPVLDGVIALPAGDVTEPFIDVEDIADVAVAALTTDGHEGVVYELTGPRLLSFADAAAELSEAIGRPIRYLPVTGEEYAAAAVQAGVPVEEAEPLDGAVRRGPRRTQRAPRATVSSWRSDDRPGTSPST